MSSEKPIVLLGAGLAGSMMAAYLAKRGYRVDVYERRPDMRKVEISAGKSINLALSVRGLHALEGIGLTDEIMDMVIPMRGRVMHSIDGELTFQPYSKDETTAINSISRGGLNVKMMELADSYDNVNFYFNWRCMGVSFEDVNVRLQNMETNEMKTVEAQTIIGADGAFSGVRNSLERSPRFSYSQEFHPAAYKELTIPPTEDGGWRMEKNALHIWPRGSYMLIALPNLDGSYTVTLFYPAVGAASFESLQTAEAVTEFFQKNFPDALELMPTLTTDFFENPTGDLVTVRCDPWHYKGGVALVGDAAHAVVPFFGQGMNAAFEDCAVLDECIGEFAPDWEKIYSEYNARRVDNGQAIATMAIENYIEMRDDVGNEDWLFRKKVEHKLEQEFPGEYISRYEMVSFTRIPYAEAYRIGEINNEILDGLTQGLKSVDDLNLDTARTWINNRLGKFKTILSTAR